MSDRKELTGAESASCVTVSLHMFLIQPIWFVLLFGILQAINAETWMWVCFLIYIPAQYAGAAFTQLAKFLFVSGQ